MIENWNQEEILKLWQTIKIRRNPNKLVKTAVKSIWKHLLDLSTNIQKLISSKLKIFLSDMVMSFFYKHQNTAQWIFEFCSILIWFGKVFQVITHYLTFFQHFPIIKLTTAPSHYLLILFFAPETRIKSWLCLKTKLVWENMTPTFLKSFKIGYE